MAIGITINVGINQVDSHNIAADRLFGCENDATEMFRIAMKHGFQSGWPLTNGERRPMLGQEAKLKNVLLAIKAAAEKLNEQGGIFLFTFAGHGSQRFVQNAVGEDDGNDETILLFDHMLLDDVWNQELWPKFNDKVRAVAIADCCHADTALLAFNAIGVVDPNVAEGALAFAGPGIADNLPVKKLKSLFHLKENSKKGPVYREISTTARDDHYKHFKSFYDNQLASLPPPAPINSRRIMLSACEQNKKAADGVDHGAFTKALLEVYNGAGFSGNYNDLMDGIKEKLKTIEQTPVIRRLGQPDFSGQRPFSIPD